MASQFQKTFRYFYYHASLWKMKKISRDQSAEALTKFIFDDCWELFRPGQVQEEVLGLARVLQARKPKVVIEIGTGRSGGMLFIYSRTAAPDAVIISIDLPGGEFGGSYPKYKTPIFKNIALPGQKIHLLHANSHEPATLKKVQARLNGRQADFLFIDGDHLYDGVQADLQMYGGLVNDEGLIALQDIVPCRHDNCRVEDFWQDLKGRYPHQEIVHSWQQKWAGIGLIEKKAMNQPL